MAGRERKRRGGARGHRLVSDTPQNVSCADRSRLHDEVGLDGAVVARVPLEALAQAVVAVADAAVRALRHVRVRLRAVRGEDGPEVLE